MAEINHDATQPTDSSDLMLPSDLPPEIIELARQDPKIKQLVLQITQRYRGPIPHPQVLREFNEVVPDSARVIIEDFKAWGDLKRDLLHKQVESELTNEATNRGLASRGQLIAAGLVLLFGIPGIVRIFMGDIAGGALLLAPTVLSGLARLFLGGQNSNRESEEKTSEKPQTSDRQAS